MGDMAALQTIRQRIIDRPKLVEQFMARLETLSIKNYVETLLLLWQERQLLPERSLIQSRERHERLGKLLE